MLPIQFSIAEVGRGVLRRAGLDVEANREKRVRGKEAFCQICLTRPFIRRKPPILVWEH